MASGPGGASSRGARRLDRQRHRLRRRRPSGGAGPGTYTTRLNSEPPGLAVTVGAGGLASNGIEVDFTAGYGAAADHVPEPLRQAVLMLAGFWFERREGLAEAGSPQGLGLPGALSALIAGYRRVRL